MSTTKYLECQTESRYPAQNQHSLTISVDLEGWGSLGSPGAYRFEDKLGYRDTEVCAALTPW